MNTIVTEKQILNEKALKEKYLIKGNDDSYHLKEDVNVWELDSDEVNGLVDILQLKSPECNTINKVDCVDEKELKEKYLIKTEDGLYRLKDDVDVWKLSPDEIKSLICIINL